MGVPALFRWLSKKYPKIVSGVIEELPYDVDGHVIPVDTTLPNPNGEETDNLYLDFNGIVHPCTHPDDGNPPATEGEMMLEIFKYTDRVVNMARPRKLLMIAVDGVAPRAKMNQQRSRRFRAAKEAKEADENKEELRKMLKSQKKSEEVPESEEDVIKKTWDYNVITPGTPFMGLLAVSLRYWISYKLNTDPAWEKLKVIISDATVPGEGEHKIMEFIRSQRSSPEHNPNTRHVMYGLDADLIMLGLGTHEPHFRVLREDVFIQGSKAQTCRLCGQQGHKAEECRGQAKEKNGDFDEKQKAAPLKPFVWLHVSVLREYLEAELYVPQQPFRFDLERAIDDWVFMCFFVGNDFLPHLPSLDIREDGIDTLIAIWRDNIPMMGGYLTKDGHVDLERAQFILRGLGKQEDAIFRKRHMIDEKRNASAKRRKQEEQERNARNQEVGGKRRRSSFDYGTPESNGKKGRGSDPAPSPDDLVLFTPGKGELTREARDLTHSMVVNRGAVYKANLANKSAAAALKSQLLKGNRDDGEASNGTPVANNEDSTEADQVATQTPPSALGKRKMDLIDDDSGSTPGRNTPVTSDGAKFDDDEPAPDTVRLWEDGYSDRYYEQKFKVDPKDIEFRHEVARSYVEGLSWVLLYYFQGCPSWTWYYPYHYAPFAADFVDLEKMKIEFDIGKPFKPYEQLMGVLPAASNHSIPEVFHSLMSDEDSEIIDFYPETFPIDMNGKKMAWQGVALLPFIDEKRLLDAMGKKYPLLTAEEHARNEMGRDVLLLSDRHPLYEELTANFYSKKQGSPKYKLNMRVSQGLAGKVEKNEAYLPHSPLVFPLEQGDMPDLDEDRSISVHYEMPKSTYLHKSMLLRGVEFAPPALDQADIQETKSKARVSGRSFGHAPLRDRDSGGRGRGGRIHYGDDRPNPFAAHLNPGFGPPPDMGNYQSGPPQPPPGWIPPPPGSASYGRGPPPPPRGGFSYGYNPPPPQYSHQGGHYGYNDQRNGGQYSGSYRDQGQGRDNHGSRYNDGYGRY